MIDKKLGVERYRGFCKICKKNRIHTRNPGSTAYPTCSKGHQSLGGK